MCQMREERTKGSLSMVSLFSEIRFGENKAYGISIVSELRNKLLFVLLNFESVYDFSPLARNIKGIFD